MLMYILENVISSHHCCYNLKKKKNTLKIIVVIISTFIFIIYIIITRKKKIMYMYIVRYIMFPVGTVEFFMQTLFIIFHYNSRGVVLSTRG